MSAIEGLRVARLTTRCDERGKLFEVLRSDDKLFTAFGQAYITTAYPGVVKAWHLHKKQTDNICLLSGNAKLVIYDPRKDSPTRGAVAEFFLSAENRLLIQIPSGVYHGFKNVGTEELYIINIPDRVYHPEDPDEYRLDPHTAEIPYDWARKDG
jgi:dTDP-4-dehydrorhamnose 3,5-epimerase